MYYSSAFVFVFVIVINLSGKVTLQSLPDRNYRMPPINPGDEIINIGNGAYKTNVIVLEDNPDSAGSDQRGGSQNEGLGNRFGTGNTYSENQPNPRPQPGQYPHTQVNHNQNPQSSNSDRTQTQGNNRPKPVAPMNSGGRTVEAQGSAHNARNNGGTSFVQYPYTQVNHNQNPQSSNSGRTQTQGNNRPNPVVPMNSGRRTVETQGSAHNARNNGGTSFVSPDVTGVFNVGYGKDNHNQIFVNSRPSQRTTPVNGGRRTTQTQSGTASNNGGYESRANINKVFVNGQPIQPDHNDGPWSTYYTNGQRIKVLNTGRVHDEDTISKISLSYEYLLGYQLEGRAQSENKLRTLYGILAQIWQIKSQLKQEAESLNIKV